MRMFVFIGFFLSTTAFGGEHIADLRKQMAEREAAEFDSRINQLFPDSATNGLEKLFYLAAIAFDKSGRINESIACYSILVTDEGVRKEIRARAAYDLGMLYSELDSTDYNQARECFSISLSCGFSDAQNEIDDIDETLKDLDSSLQEGHIYFKREQYGQACKKYQFAWQNGNKKAAHSLYDLALKIADQEAAERWKNTINAPVKNDLEDHVFQSRVMHNLLNQAFPELEMVD